MHRIFGYGAICFSFVLIVACENSQHSHKQLHTHTPISPVVISQDLGAVTPKLTHTLNAGYSHVCSLCFYQTQGNTNNPKPVIELHGDLWNLRGGIKKRFVTLSNNAGVSSCATTVTKERLVVSGANLPSDHNINYDGACVPTEKF